MPRDPNPEPFDYPPSERKPFVATKPGFAALIALVGAGAAAVLVPTVQGWEGRETVPYRDIVGIWTVCDGDTKNVVPGQVQSHAQCDARLERQLLAHAKPVLACTPGLKDKPNALAAAISLAYNIGAAAYCRSSVDRRFDAGDVAGACDAFLMWNKAGGRVVRGLQRRRAAERAICLRDAGAAIDEPDMVRQAAAPAPTDGRPSDFNLQFVVGAELCPLAPARDPQRINRT